ncbi:protein insensitive-like [Pieris napi]|uniref:protein insensitive-like n=1 Tax=Pieris napi TaxID=78633 RepID=UPI001FBA08DE|nr:protein insensitive-like [Pieris napi]
MSARLSTVTVDESSSSMTMEEESPKTSRKRTRSCTSESSDQSVSDETLEPVRNNMIRIGDGNAKVPVKIYTSIKWDSYTIATRKLLTAVFPRHILATHSLTGKRSPAFPNRPAKEKLNPKLINDIVKTVAEKCGVAENIVRTAITNKCADEGKMMRQRKKHKIEDDHEE